MKKIFTSFCAALLTVAASAQVTATISPSTKNVFTPSEYEFVSVTYGDTLDLSSVSATVAYNGSTANVPVDSTTTLQALFDIDAAITSLSVPDGGVFTVSVSGVSGADDASASYKYYATTPTPTASTADGSTLESKTADITFTFSTPLVCQSIGFASGSQYNTVELDSVLTSSVTASILESYWDSTSASLTVSLDGLIDADGYSYPTYEAIYYYTVDTVTYLGYSPSNTSCTYQDVWDTYWTVDFKFDKEIIKPESGYAAKVTFCYDGMEMISVDIEDYDVDVVETTEDSTTYYEAKVMIPEVPEEAEGYESAIVELVGFTYGGQLISQPSATYYSALISTAKASKIGGTTGIQGTPNAVYNTANVYNMQGVLVKTNATISDINGLVKGVYIINGKKVIVK